jgi:hypothetical protein
LGGQVGSALISGARKNEVFKAFTDSLREIGSPDGVEPEVLRERSLMAINRRLCLTRKGAHTVARFIRANEEGSACCSPHAYCGQRTRGSQGPHTVDRADEEGGDGCANVTAGASSAPVFLRAAHFAYRKTPRQGFDISDAGIPNLAIVLTKTAQGFGDSVRTGLLLWERETVSSPIQVAGRHMSYELELAAGYRRHAKQLRTIADGDREPKTAAMLRSVASSYDQMADTLEHIERTNAAVRKPKNSN